MYPVSRCTEHTALRELTADDVGDVFALYADPLVTRNLSFDPRGRDQVEGIVARSIAAATADPRVEYVLAITATSGEFMGVARMALDTVDPDLPVTIQHPAQSAQLGGALKVDRWQQGHGAATSRMLFALAFNDLGLYRLWAARSPANEGSRALMQGAGMIEERVIRHHVFTGGAWRDSVVHSILRDEYRRRVPAPQ